MRHTSCASCCVGKPESLTHVTWCCVCNERRTLDSLTARLLSLDLGSSLYSRVWYLEKWCWFHRTVISAVFCRLTLTKFVVRDYQTCTKRTTRFAVNRIWMICFVYTRPGPLSRNHYKTLWTHLVRTFVNPLQKPARPGSPKMLNLVKWGRLGQKWW